MLNKVRDIRAELSSLSQGRIYTSRSWKRPAIILHAMRVRLRKRRTASLASAQRKKREKKNPDGLGMEILRIIKISRDEIRPVRERQREKRRKDIRGQQLYILYRRIIADTYESIISRQIVH